MSQKHCNSETLLAYLDHELPDEEQRAVIAHLAACWRCRARAGEIERQIQRLAQEFTAGSYPSYCQTTEAKRRFLTWRDRYDQEMSYSVTFAALPREFSRPAAATLAALMVAIAGFLIWGSAHSSRDAVLARAERAEQAIINSSAIVHESYRLEVKQLSPHQVTSQSYLDLWSDRTSERFAWRWRDDQHRLTFAEWKPGPKEHYVFSPQGSIAVTSKESRKDGSGSLAETLESAATIQQLNRAFVGWVGGQQWHLISIARDFASFSNHHGVAFSMRRLHARGNRSTLVLEAARARNGKRLTLTLEIDEATGQPVAELAQISSREFSMEFRVVADQVEPLLPLPALFAVFRPEIATNVNVSAKPPAVVRPTTPVRKPVVFDSRLLDAAEVEVLYVLHHAGLCLGAPLAVHQDARLNLVLLTGLVDAAQTREKIVSEISQLPSTQLIRVELKTSDEAMAESKPLLSSTLNMAGDAAPASPPVLAIETLVDKSSLSENEKLALKASMADRANEFVSATENLLRESWALKRLTRYFSPAQTERLEGESRTLISKMAVDHLKAIRQQISTLESITSPIKTLLAGQSSLTGESISNEQIGASNWNSTADSLVSAAEQIVTNSQLLFALRDAPVAVKSDTAAINLMKALPRFGQILGKAEKQLGHMESRNTLSGTDLPSTASDLSRTEKRVPPNDR